MGEYVDLIIACMAAIFFFSLAKSAAVIPEGPPLLSFYTPGFWSRYASVQFCAAAMNAAKTIKRRMQYLIFSF